MVDLTTGQVAAIIAFGIVVARVWCPTIGTFILAGLLNDRETAATWTVAAKHIQSSYWPLLLRSDAIKDRGVRKSIVIISLLLPLLSFLIAIAGVVTPLGLYESNEPKSKAVSADFEYVRDSSTFYSSTSTRDDKPFTRTCTVGLCYVTCPYTSDVTVVESNGATTNCTLFGTIDPNVPNILREVYTSGTQYGRTTISNYFDIEWRQTTTQYDRQLNNGTPVAAGIYRRLETIALLDDVRAVEGLVVDAKEGKVGFRNHTIPSGYPLGVMWTEDLLFWEPDVECVDTNTTFDFEITTSSQEDAGVSISKFRLTDRGGFININTTAPLEDQRNGVNQPDLKTRAYQAAWATNAFSMLFMNISNAGSEENNIEPFQYIDSKIGKEFKIPSPDLDASYLSLGLTNDFGYHLGVRTISDSDDLYENPWNITTENFIAIRDLCQGTKLDMSPKLNNTFVMCNLMRGIPQRVGDGPENVFDDKSQWSSSLYACASAVKATVKTVTFFYNGTDARSNNIEIKEIKDKVYTADDDMPLWGVEDSPLELDVFPPIWGLVDRAYDKFQNMSTVRAPSLYFLGSGSMSPVRWELDSGFVQKNLPASIAPIGAFFTIFSSVDNSLSPNDVVGKSSMSLWLKWRELSKSADSASTILKLLWTDFVASAVVGTKGVLGARNAQPEDAAEVSVVPLEHRIRYRWVYGIPAFLLLACMALIAGLAALSLLAGRSNLDKMRYRLKQTSLGRVLTTLVGPQSSNFVMSTGDWSKNNASKNIDLGINRPVLDLEPQEQTTQEKVGSSASETRGG
ncbi:hypothetical protein FALBO_12474 [Fusarium albosuccineum]|uniref:Uncharacterized protein n=1 Tax=Fusarium albosuccineum TaxID=1237068 RepID=A0A8H4P7Y8_9HYPO|nr:hypothetical protein FALBO_12474 [Fusarium albosuccineum]